MTLLKAGSISRKRINLLLLIILLALPIYSAELRVMLASDDSNELDFLSSALSAFGGTADSSYALSAYNERASRENQIKKEKEIDSSYQSEKTIASGSADVSSFDGTLDIKYIYPEVAEGDKRYLRAGDEYAYSYYKAKESADLILYLKSETIGGVDYMSLLLDGNVIREGVYLSELMDEEERELLTVLMPYFKSDEYRLYELSLPSLSSVIVDGLSLAEGTAFIALKAGEHEFYISSPRYKSSKFIVNVGEESVIEFTLEEKEERALFINMRPYDAELYYQGDKMESHLIRSSVSPFSIALKRPGFAFYSFESKRDIDTLDLYMRPEWMDDSNILKNEKEEFYKSLFTTLISFGAAIGAESLKRIYSEVDFGPADVVFTGVSLVSLIYMIDSISSYYNAARYSL